VGYQVSRFKIGQIRLSISETTPDLSYRRTGEFRAESEYSTVILFPQLLTNDSAPFLGYCLSSILHLPKEAAMLLVVSTALHNGCMLSATMGKKK